MNFPFWSNLKNIWRRSYWIEMPRYTKMNRRNTLANAAGTLTPEMIHEEEEAFDKLWHQAAKENGTPNAPYAATKDEQ